MANAIEDPVLIELPKGGQYTAERNPDGSWNVRDVPIFVCHDELDEKWCEKAIARAQQRLGEGYVAPLHFRHHSFTSDSPADAAAIPPAGSFVPKRLGKLPYEGTEANVVFADFLGVPDEIYQQIKSGKIKHRSVEIYDTSRSEFDTCALLDHEPPRWKLPILTIGKEVDRNSPSFYSARTPRRAVAICRAREETVMEKKTETPAASPGAATAAPAAPTAENGAQVLQAINGLAQMFSQAFSKLEQLLGAGQSPPSQTTPAPAEQHAVSGAVAFGEKPVVGSTPELAAKFVALEKQLHTERARFAQLERQLKTNDAVAAAKSRLAKAGFALTDEDEADLRGHAEKGLEVLEAAVVSREKYGAKEPPRAWTGELGRGRQVARKGLEKFAQLGPDALSKAEIFAADYDRMPEFARKELTLESFVRGQLVKAGIKVEA